jgi:Fic family protein
LVLNTRQLKVILRIFDAVIDGFDGGMNARKYMGITKTLKATATRDLQELSELGIFTPSGAGRNTSYHLTF